MPVLSENPFTVAKDIIEEIKELELSKMTPIDALNTLFGIQDKIKNRW